MVPGKEPNADREPRLDQACTMVFEQLKHLQRIYNKLLGKIQFFIQEDYTAACNEIFVSLASSSIKPNDVFVRAEEQ